MENKISIIVPVYNVEKYIGKCLDSLVKQDYSNYDILVVNDGSPFNEQAIIDEYVKKYPSIIKSIVKENGGYGSVLQLAFNKSDADYILVCDPDDYLADDALSTLISYQKKDDVDLVVGAKNLVYEDSDEETYDASYNAEFGKLVNGKKYTTQYQHLASINVKVGQTVRKTDVIGYSGGYKGVTYWDSCSTGAHLHFTVLTGWIGSDYYWSSDPDSGYYKNLIDPRTVVSIPYSWSTRY